MIETVGIVQRETPLGVLVLCQRPPLDHLADRVSVQWADGRTISPEQRMKAWALIGEICAWAGYNAREMSEMNEQMKARFLMDTVDKLQKKVFSLSDCDMSTARAYIDYLVDFCLTMDVPTKMPLMEMAEDEEKYTYACMVHKKCAVCGKKAELHHVDQIGMGYDRNEKPQLGCRVLPLCREHHTQYHTQGKETFLHLYHVTPCRLDEKLSRIWKIPREARENA